MHANDEPGFIRSEIRAIHQNRPVVRILVLAFLLAFTARFLFATLAFPFVAERTGLNTGSDGYEKIAHNLLAGNGFRVHPEYAQTTLRMPAYPYLLTGIFTICGEKMWAVQLLQSLFGAATTALITWMAFRSFGTRTALVTGICFSLYPGDLVACSRFLAEPLAILLMVINIIIFARLKAQPTLRWALILGIGLALMGQTKSSFALLPPVLLIILVVSRVFWSNPKRAVSVVAAVIIPIVLISIPWIYRGYSLTGHIFYPSTLGGQGLMDGYYVGANLSSGKPVRELLYEGRKKFRQLAAENNIGLDPKDRYSWTFKTALDEYRMDQVLKEEFKRTVLENPLDFVKRSLLGILRFWYLSPNHKLTNISMFSHLPLILLAIIGAVRALRRQKCEVWLWIWVVLYFNVLNGVIDPLVRYAIATIPFVMILAASALFYRESVPQRAPAIATRST